jgi:hypothetical protein
MHREFRRIFDQGAYGAELSAFRETAFSSRNCVGSGLLDAFTAAPARKALVVAATVVNV